MFEMILLSLRVRFSIAANKFIYFLRNLPILKRVLPPSLHGEYVLKTILTVFGAIFIASKKSFFHFLVMACAFVAGSVMHLILLHGGIINVVTSGDTFAGFDIFQAVHLSLFAWTCVIVIGFFTQTKTANVALTYKYDDIMINYLNANPATYAKSRILLDQISRILLYTPYLLVAFFVAGIPLWGVLPTFLLLIATRSLGEVTNLAMFKRFGIHFGRGAVANIVGIPALVAALFIPLQIPDFNLSIILANPIIGSVSAALIFLSWLYILKYAHYRNMFRKEVSFYLDFMNKHAKSQQGGTMAAEFASAKKWSKNISEKDLDSSRFNHKKGFSYLNAIFFDRHSKFFRRKLLLRCGIITLLPLLFFGSIIIGGLVEGTFVFGDSIRDYIDLGTAHLSGLFVHAPFFFFIIYIASMGRIVTASVFSNCDIQMLHYSYYRTRDNIFSSFKSRITEILKFNFIITTLMSAVVILVLSFLFGYFNFAYFGTFFALLTAIGVLFAFNDLFLYYVIQPYDDAGAAKSTVYKIINFVIYAVAWMNLQLQLDFFTYSAVIVIATVAYFGIGLVLLLMLAPRRFKLR